MGIFIRSLLALFVGCATVGLQADSCIFPSRNGSCSNELIAPNRFRAYASPDPLKLAVENEQYVRAIMRSVGVEHKFTEIRRMSDWEIMLMGRKNAYVSKNFTGYKMVISEEWFNELTPAERRFLTGHETMHVRLGHCERYLSPHNKVHMAISRECERHADLASAVVLTCADGGILLFTGMKQMAFANADDGSAPQDDPRDYYSHPALDERIEYLRPLAEDQAKGVSLHSMQPAHLQTIAMACAA